MTAHHPYRDLPDYQFWPRAVSWAAPGGLDPVAADQVPCDAGRSRRRRWSSCSRQHLSRHLSRSGLTYFVAGGGRPPVGDQGRDAATTACSLRATATSTPWPRQFSCSSRLRRLRPGRPAGCATACVLIRSVRRSSPTDSPTPRRSSRSAAALRRDPCRVRRVRRAGVHARAHRSVAITG